MNISPAQPPRLDDHERLHERAVLEVEVTFESEHNFYAGITDNVSEGGLFIATHTPPPIGATITLTLSLPGGAEPFEMSGIVRWIRDIDAACEGCPPGCGVQFLRVPDFARRLIERYVSARDTILYDDEAAA